MSYSSAYARRSFATLAKQITSARSNNGIRFHQAAASHPIITRQFSSPDDDNKPTQKPPSLFLHVGPTGDCWTGEATIAKLEPPPTKSIPLWLYQPPIDSETLLEALKEDPPLVQAIYDRGVLSKQLLERIRAAIEKVEKERTRT